MLVENFKAIVDAFDKSSEMLKDRTREAIKEAEAVVREGRENEKRELNVDEAINQEFRKLRSYVLDAVVADEKNNATCLKCENYKVAK